MVLLRFDFRDIFKSNRLAFSLQRMWIQFIGIATGYLGYLVLTYLSIIIAGQKFSEVWHQMGIFPCLAGFDAAWYSWLIFIIGALFLLAVYLVTAAAVSRAAYMLLKGNNFYTWKEAFCFAFRKSSAVLFSPLAIAILIGLFLIGAAVVGLLAKIPYVGELGFSLLYFIWLMAGLLIVFFVIALITSLILSPAIIATTDDDAFEAVFQSFATFWNQPWRLIAYQALTGALSVVGFLVLAFLVKKAFLLTDSIFTYIVGDKYINLMGQGMYIITGWIAVSISWMQSLLGESIDLFYFSRDFLQLQLPTVINIASYIFAVMWLFIGGWIVSYGLSTFNVGNTLIYLVLRKIKDDENLLEREDMEEMEDEELEEEKTGNETDSIEDENK